MPLRMDGPRMDRATMWDIGDRLSLDHITAVF